MLCLIMNPCMLCSSVDYSKKFCSYMSDTFCRRYQNVYVYEAGPYGNPPPEDWKEVIS